MSEAKKNDSELSALLKTAVADDESLGSHDISHRLGIQKMPLGYALMLNADCSHCYWLRYDGVNSCMSWDKWATYRGAKEDAAKDF